MEFSYCKKFNDSFFTVLDVLKKHFQVSSRLLLKLKRYNLIFLNNKVCNISDKIYTNDTVSFSLNYSENNSNIVPIEMKLNIVYEDNCMLILDKPAGVAIHPSLLHYDNSLSNGVKYYFDFIDLKKKIRPVNRLDRNTSGLVVFAKNEYVQEFLIKQMNSKSFNKEYIAILEGIIFPKHGTIDKPISRKEGSIIERCINDNRKTICNSLFCSKRI